MFPSISGDEKEESASRQVIGSASGRGRVKSSDIGQTNHARTSKEYRAQIEKQLYTHATLQTYAPQAKMQTIGSRRRRPQQQQQQTGSDTPNDGAAGAATNDGSLSARTPPVAGRRARASQVGSTAQSARPSRRGSNSTNKRDQSDDTDANSAAAMLMAPMPLLSAPRPDWLGPYPTPEPPRQAMIDPLLAPQGDTNRGQTDMMRSDSHQHNKSHPHQLKLPHTNTFSYYRPVSPPKRHTCEGGPTSHLRHYMYAHRLQQARSVSPNSTSPAAKRKHQQYHNTHSHPHPHPHPLHSPPSVSPLSGVGSTSSLSGGGSGVSPPGAAVPPSAEIAPEAWSSWPFVNPRLTREERTTNNKDTMNDADNNGKKPTAVVDEKEEEDGKTGVGVSSSVVPSLPSVSRLYSSLVTEHDRTTIFEYLRSTFSELFQWPQDMKRQQVLYLQHQAQITTKAAQQNQTNNNESTTNATNGDAANANEAESDPNAPAASVDSAAGSTSASGPASPLPPILFTDRSLDLLLEESRTAENCIVLLRRLDGELARATIEGTIGKPPPIDIEIEEEEEKKNASNTNANASEEEKVQEERPPTDGPSKVDAANSGDAAIGDAPVVDASLTSVGTATLISPTSTHSSSSALPPPPPSASILEPVTLPPRSPVRVFESAEELIAAVRETRIYLEALRRKIFHWFTLPRRSHTSVGDENEASDTPVATSSSSSSSRPLAIFSGAPGTVFLTLSMVDRLLSIGAKQGLNEEEVWRWLRQVDERASADPSYGCISVEDLEQRLRYEACERMRRALQQNIPGASHTGHNSSGVGVTESPHSDGSGHHANGAVGVNTSNPSMTATASGVNGGSMPSPTQSHEADVGHSLVVPHVGGHLMGGSFDSSPSFHRHMAHSQAYARLLLFKYLRDGAGSILFADALDVAATIQEMDALLESTSGLTLGQNYQNIWYHMLTQSANQHQQQHQQQQHMHAQHHHAPNASTPHAASDALVVSGAHTVTRPVTPESAAVVPSSSSLPPSAASSSDPAYVPPGAVPSVAASTRAYGSFLAARAIRVLRSLTFHGYTGFTRFDDLIAAAEIHTRKLHAERVKVYDFLTRGQHALPVSPKMQRVGGVTSAAPSPRSGNRSMAVASDLPFTLDLTPPYESNVARNVGLFNAYYEEVARREKAREEAAIARAQQLKSNTHQFGTSHYNINSHAGGAKHQQQPHQQQLQPHAYPHPPLVGPPVLSPRSHLLSSSVHPPTTASKRSARAARIPMPPAATGRHANSAGGAGDSNHPGRLIRKAATDSGTTTNAAGIPSHVITRDTPPPPKEKDPLKYYDWSVNNPSPSAAAAAAAALPGGAGDLTLYPPVKAASAQSNMSRYASNKTLPPTPSKSLLLKPNDPEFEWRPLGDTTGKEEEQLPALHVTPEDIDGLFGSFTHLLQLASLPSADKNGLFVSTDPFGVAAAHTATFDPLIEQEDEDYLLEAEQEEAWNSMDLTMLLQAYKQERPTEMEDRERQPSYLAEHPLFKPMLDQLNKQQQAEREEQRQQEKRQQESDAYHAAASMQVYSPYSPHARSFAPHHVVSGGQHVTVINPPRRPMPPAPTIVEPPPPPQHAHTTKEVVTVDVIENDRPIDQQLTVDQQGQKVETNADLNVNGDGVGVVIDANQPSDETLPPDSQQQVSSSDEAHPTVSSSIDLQPGAADSTADSEPSVAPDEPAPAPLESPSQVVVESPTADANVGVETPANVMSDEPQVAPSNDPQTAPSDAAETESTGVEQTMPVGHDSQPSENETPQVIDAQGQEQSSSSAPVDSIHPPQSSPADSTVESSPSEPPLVPTIVITPVAATVDETTEAKSEPDSSALNDVAPIDSTPTPSNGDSALPVSSESEPAYSAAAQEFALDTSNDLIILDPNAEFDRWNALESVPHTAASPPPAAAATAATPNGSRPATSPPNGEETTTPVPKMLPVVWQTLQLLREQGKIKIPVHSSSAASSAGPASASHASGSWHVNPNSGTGPAGPGSGHTGLGPFIPNSGPVIPGGSMGSMKTLQILRELSKSGRAFFNMHELIQTVCSMRAERKWSRRVQEKEKKKLIAAGITIATPSGLPNDPSFGVGIKRRMLKVHHGVPSSSSNSSHPSPPISAAQFALLHDGLSRDAVRQIHVVDEDQNGEANYNDDNARTNNNPNNSNNTSNQVGVLHATPSETFLSAHDFPRTFDTITDLPPAQSRDPTSNQRGGRGTSPHHTRVDSLTASPAVDSHSRGWCRARLLTHLSGLLLFQGSIAREQVNANPNTNDANTHGRSPSAHSRPSTQPPKLEVVVRMADLEALLDALGNGPRDAIFLSDKIARKERDALAKEALLPSNAGALAKQTLQDLPPLGHSLSPLLAVLTWLDSQEILFHSMADLVRCIASGEWALEFKSVERVRIQEKANEHEFQVSRLGQNARAEAEKLVMEP